MGKNKQQEELFKKAEVFLWKQGFVTKREKNENENDCIDIYYAGKRMGWVEIANYKNADMMALEFVTMERVDFDKFKELTKEFPFRQWLINNDGFPLIAPDGITISSQN